MEIITYTEAPAGSKHLAEIEVYHNKTYFRRIRVMVSLKGYHFINLPVFGIEDGKGGKKWVQFWEWSKSEDEEFKRLVLEELKGYMERSGRAQIPTTAPSPVIRQSSQPDLGDCPF